MSLQSEQIALDITQAVPCGLIANELQQTALIRLSGWTFGYNQGVVSVADDRCFLEISDDGVGFPPNLQPQDSTSMGLQLVILLVQQLKGTLEMDRNWVRASSSPFRISRRDARLIRTLIGPVPLIQASTRSSQRTFYDGFKT